MELIIRLQKTRRKRDYLFLKLTSQDYLKQPMIIMTTIKLNKRFCRIG